MYNVKLPLVSVRGPIEVASYPNSRTEIAVLAELPITKEFIVTGSVILTVVDKSINTSSVTVGTTFVFQFKGSDHNNPSPSPSELPSQMIDAAACEYQN